MPTELESNIRGTIDEKIQELVDWSARYPKAYINYECPTYILEEYAQSEEELKKLQEQYERMRRHYSYVIARRSQRKINVFTRNCV